MLNHLLTSRHQPVSFHELITQVMTRIVIILIVIIASGMFARANAPVVWELKTRAEILRGTSRGVSITETGALMLAPRFDEVFDTKQSYVWSSVVDKAGNVYLGTGNDGRIFRVASNGDNATSGTLFYDSPELNVTALAVDANDVLYAATSPDGKVYRITQGGQAEVFFDPPDKYIWSLAMMNDGALAVGTGDKGIIYRVPVESGAANNVAGNVVKRAPEALVFYDSSETHIISLAINRTTGDLIAGTDPGGLVLRVDRSGKAFALLDAPLREMHALSIAPDDSIYALAIGDAAASPSRLSGAGSTTLEALLATATSSTTNPPATPPDGSPPAVVGGTDTTNAASSPLAASVISPAAKSRRRLAGARSALFRITPDGSSEVVWSSQGVTAFSLVARGGDVLLGTNERGRILSIDAQGDETLLTEASENQISSFVTHNGELFAASSNAGKLFRVGRNSGSIGTRSEAHAGTYESPVQDAQVTAQWGNLSWRVSGAGEGNNAAQERVTTQATTQVTMQTRSGNTEQPDRTWSDWSAAYTDGGGSNITSPPARFIQWRVTLTASATVNQNVNMTEKTRVEDVRLVYLPRNVAPEIISLTALPPNVVLLPTISLTGDAGNDANPDNPLTTTTTTTTTGAASPAIAIPPRRTFQRGAMSLQWQAEDANNDRMEYTIAFRGVGESRFQILRTNLRDNFFTIDAATLADGRYVFRVTASDALDNPASRALTGERVSEAFDIDATPPEVQVIPDTATTDASSNVRGVRFSVEDATSVIRRADVSINGGRWTSIYPDDGIADERRETFTIALPTAPAGSTETADVTIALRAFDTNGNVGNARTVQRRR